MGLQLRMTHSLGQRLVEVEARKADQAIVVGRASNAEVQIPSANISKRHCLLFVHDGRWVVQDADSPSGTFLNGERLTEPAFINSGDVISLGRGSNPPTLTVDPHSVGVTEEIQEAAPAARVAAAPSQPWSPPPAPAPGHAMPPPLMPQQPPPPRGFVHEEESDNIFGAPAAAAAQFYGPPGSYSPPGSVPGYGVPPAPALDEWGNPAIPPAKPRRRVIKAQTHSQTGIVIGVVAAILILIGGIAWINHNSQKPEEVQKQIIVPPPAQEHKAPGSIFEEGPPRPRPDKSGAGNTPAPAVATAQNPTPPAKVVPKAKPAAATAEMEPAPDKRREDPEWDAIESARTQDDPQIAIAKYQDYLDRYPDSPNKKDIEKYTDEALDRLWWNHLSELFQDRDEAQKQIASLKAEIAVSQDADFKKENAAKIAKATALRDDVDSTIHETMKFTGQSAPNPFAADEKAIARKSRDTKYFEETWKPQVLRVIKNWHGQRLPWKSSR